VSIPVPRRFVWTAFAILLSVLFFIFVPVIHTGCMSCEDTVCSLLLHRAYVSLSYHFFTFGVVWIDNGALYWETGQNPFSCQ
jgi:hypothetical protein